MKICTMSGFFNENLQGKSTDDNKISNYLSQLQLQLFKTLFITLIVNFTLFHDKQA